MGAAPWGGLEGSPLQSPRSQCPGEGVLIHRWDELSTSAALPPLLTARLQSQDPQPLTGDFPPARECCLIAHGPIRPEATHPDTDNLCIQLAADNFPSLPFLLGSHPTASC